MRSKNEFCFSSMHSVIWEEFQFGYRWLHWCVCICNNNNTQKNRFVPRNCCSKLCCCTRILWRKQLWIKNNRREKRRFWNCMNPKNVSKLPVEQTVVWIELQQFTHWCRVICCTLELLFICLLFLQFVRVRQNVQIKMMPNENIAPL